MSYVHVEKIYQVPGIYFLLFFLVLSFLSVISVLCSCFSFVFLRFLPFISYAFMCSFFLVLCLLLVSFVVFLLQVERLKGLQLKFTAFYKLLLESPHLAEKIVLLQVWYTS